MIEADKITPPTLPAAPVAEKAPEAPAEVVAETLTPAPMERITDQLSPKPKTEPRPEQPKPQARSGYKGPRPEANKANPHGKPQGDRRESRPGRPHPPKDASRPQDARAKVELPPGIVDYPSIVQALLKASRVRRHQHIEANGPITHLKDVRNFHTVSLQGPSRSGQTQFILQAFMKRWSETIVIVHEQKDLVALEAKIAECFDSAKGKRPQFFQIFTVDAIIGLLGRLGVPEVQKARQQITITIDKDDESPQATIADLLEEYIQKRDEMRGVELRPTHPLRRVNTIYVDGWKACETSNLTFARLVRFAQMGGMLPELVLLG